MQYINMAELAATAPAPPLLLNDADQDKLAIRDGTQDLLTVARGTGDTYVRCDQQG